MATIGTAVRVEIEGPAATLTLDRPEKRNALSLALMEELIEALARAAQTEGVRAIVLAGNGPAFSAGHDLSEMVGRERAFYDHLFDVCTELMEAIHRIPQPVIAKVHGIATAAGCQLVAACDLAVASEEARFATPGVKIGLFCSTPMVPVSRAIGRKRALQLLLTGEPIDAATAAEWGLVNRVVPAVELSDPLHVGDSAADADQVICHLQAVFPRFDFGYRAFKASLTLRCGLVEVEFPGTDPWLLSKEK